MTRRESREAAFCAAFEASFGANTLEEVFAQRRLSEEPVPDAYGKKLLRAAAEHAEEIDSQIAGKLAGWNLDRISRVSRTVLRLAVAEMLYLSAETPHSVAINEAVELMKKFGGEEDYQFVNGVLGTVARQQTEEA